MIDQTEQDVRFEEERMKQVTRQYASFVSSLKNSGMSTYLPNIHDIMREYYARMRYDLYLMTAHWSNVREDCIKEKGGSCIVCGDARSIRIHHASYSERGTSFEYLDCFPLCNNCHEIIERAKIKFRQIFESDLFRSEEKDKEKIVRSSVLMFEHYREKTSNRFCPKNTSRIMSMIMKSLLSTINIQQNEYGGLYHEAISMVSKNKAK